MENKKIGIITFEKYLGRKGIGSSRIRGHWLIKHWPEAEEFVQGKSYDVMIYQKAYWVEHAKSFKGIKILDLCDPDFLHWTFRTKEMIEEVDAVTTSTEALAEAYRAFTDKPVICIPDRIDLDEIQTHKYHLGKAKTVSWYGYSTNFDMLRPVVPFLKKFKFNLNVISNSGFTLPVGITDVTLSNYPFNWDTIYQDLLDSDIVINPQSSRGKWRFKSNNKTILAWALGLPVATNIQDLQRFKDEEERKKEQALRLQEVKDKWDIKYSVEQYKQLITSLEENKF